jgi:hypothetical protein
MGPNYWTFPVSKPPVRERAARAPSVSSGQPVDADVWVRIDRASSAATAGAWRLADATMEGASLDARLDTAAGTIVVRVAPVTTGGRCYAAIDGLGYSYVNGPDLVKPDLAVFKRWIAGVHGVARELLAPVRAGVRSLRVVC